jgi:hypothetical protein
MPQDADIQHARGAVIDGLLRLDIPKKKVEDSEKVGQQVNQGAW